MITSQFLFRLLTRFSAVSCLFVLVSTLYAQNAAPAAAPAARPAQPAPASKPAADKPLSVRFTEIEKDSDEDRIRNQTSTIINKGKFEKTEDKEIFIQYYKNYFFGRWINSGRFYQVDTYPETLRCWDLMSSPVQKYLFSLLYILC